jgi:hypothetical protein
MKIITGILSTTHIDRQNERMTKEALDSTSLQIKSEYIPFLFNHDWNMQIGVILYGEVFRLNDGHYALGIVSGIFETQKEREEYENGKPNKAWKEHKKFLRINNLIKMVADNKNGINIGQTKRKDSRHNNLADLLEAYLDSTQLLPDGTVYKIKRFIASTGDLKIMIYPNDHCPAHFHVLSVQREINARFDINTLELINTKAGQIRGNDIVKIKDFFIKHPTLLEKLRKESLKFSK